MILALLSARPGSQHELPAPLTCLSALELTVPAACPPSPHTHTSHSLSEADSSPTAQTAAGILVFRKAFLDYIGNCPQTPTSPPNFLVPAEITSLTASHTSLPCLPPQIKVPKDRRVAAAYSRLQPPAAAYNHLQPPTATCSYLQ